MIKFSLFVRLSCVNLLILFSIIFSAFISHAGTYTETFSGPLNPNIWEVFTSGHGETVEVTDGKLVIKVPGIPTGQTYYAGIRSKFDHGDKFEATVGYELITWPWDNKASAGIYGSNMNTIRKQVNEYSLGPHWFEVASADFHGNGGYVKLASEGLQGGMTGSLRLTYQNLTGDGYYNLGAGWQPIYGYSPHNDDGKFMLQVVEWGGSAGAGKDVEVHFDNFKISGPNVHVVKNMPAIYLLLLN
jgi:hypothetical protein